MPGSNAYVVGSPASSHLLVVFLRDQYCDCYSLIINSLNVSEEHTLSMFADASKLEEVVMHWREEPVFGRGGTLTGQKNGQAGTS